MQERFLNIFPTDLSRMELETSPDDLDQLPHGDMVRDEELGLVEDWQLLLS